MSKSRAKTLTSLETRALILETSWSGPPPNNVLALYSCHLNKSSKRPGPSGQSWVSAKVLMILWTCFAPPGSSSARSIFSGSASVAGPSLLPLAMTMTPPTLPSLLLLLLLLPVSPEPPLVAFSAAAAVVWVLSSCLRLRPAMTLAGKLSASSIQDSSWRKMKKVSEECLKPLR